MFYFKQKLKADSSSLAVRRNVNGIGKASFYKLHI